MLLSCPVARRETRLAWVGAYGLCSSPSGESDAPSARKRGRRLCSARPDERRQRKVGLALARCGRNRDTVKRKVAVSAAAKTKCLCPGNMAALSRARPAAAAAQTPTQRGGAGPATQTASAAASVTLLSFLRVSQSLPQHPPHTHTHPRVSQRQAAVYASPCMGGGAPGLGGRPCSVWWCMWLGGGGAAGLLAGWGGGGR